MRNPLRTKKTFTEMIPPAAQANPPWLAMMPRIETARIAVQARACSVSWVPTPRAGRFLRCARTIASLCPTGSSVTSRLLPRPSVHATVTWASPPMGPGTCVPGRGR